MKNRIVLASLALAATGFACGGAPAPRADAAATAPPPASVPQAGLPPGHPKVAAGAAPGAGADTGHASVAGTVLLSPKLEAAAGDVLYLIAKQGNATVAVQRIERPAFPLAFELSGADAMVGGAAFEGPLDLVARLSRSGDAIPAPGDLEGFARGVAVPAAGVRLTIDSARP